MVGDNLIARGNLVGNRIVAMHLWSNIAGFFGAIKETRSNAYSVLTPRGNQRTVVFDGNTLSVRSIPILSSEIQVGRTAQTVGLRLPDGTVYATKVVIYDNGAPINMPVNATIINPRTGLPFTHVK
jgi:hypothetical protein